jgi:hypothetical protein
LRRTDDYWHLFCPLLAWKLGRAALFIHWLLRLHCQHHRRRLRTNALPASQRPQPPPLPHLGLLPTPSLIPTATMP